MRAIKFGQYPTAVRTNASRPTRREATSLPSRYMYGSVNRPIRTVPIFRVRKDNPVPKIQDMRSVQYIWMASRPVLRGKKIRVWPWLTSYTSRSFSA